MSCGTAAFTVNRAAFKTHGNLTTLTLNITITAAGTHTNVLTCALPNTANGSANVSAVSHEIAGCLTQTFSTAATCNKRAGANFAVSERWVFTGADENE